MLTKTLGALFNRQGAMGAGLVPGDHERVPATPAVHNKVCHARTMFARPYIIIVAYVTAPCSADHGMPSALRACSND